MCWVVFKYSTFQDLERFRGKGGWPKVEGQALPVMSETEGAFV